MLKTSLFALGMLTGLAAASARVSAQEPVAASTPCPCGATVAAGGVGSPVAAPIQGTLDGLASPVVLGAPTNAQSGPIHPYSYYIDFPNPARTYVPYGPNDTFTYQGRAYGHAYDRWTWPAMSNASPGLGRYYQLLH